MTSSMTDDVELPADNAAAEVAANYGKGARPAFLADTAQHPRRLSPLPGRKASARTLCPKCERMGARVIDSKSSAAGYMRRYGCRCGHRWSTLELVARQRFGGRGPLVPVGWIRARTENC